MLSEPVGGQVSFCFQHGIMPEFLESSVSIVMSQLVSVMFSLAFKIVLYLIWLIFCFHVFCLMQSVGYFLLSGVMSDLVCVRRLQRFRLSKSGCCFGDVFLKSYTYMSRLVNVWYLRSSRWSVARGVVHFQVLRLVSQCQVSSDFRKETNNNNNDNDNHRHLLTRASQGT